MLLGSGVMSLRQMSLEKSAIQHFMGSTATIKVQVATDPTLTKAKVFGSTLAPASYSFLGTALSVEGLSGKFTLRIPIRVITTSKEVGTFLPGQTFIARGALSKSKEVRVGALFIIPVSYTHLTLPTILRV